MVVEVKEKFEKTRQVINTYYCKYTLVLYSYHFMSHNYYDRIKYSYNCKYISSILTIILVLVVIYFLKILISLKNPFYEDNEM